MFYFDPRQNVSNSVCSKRQFPTREKQQKMKGTLVAGTLGASPFLLGVARHKYRLNWNKLK
jgi:hypothetical protein